VSRIVETGAGDSLGRCEARVAAPGIGRLGPADAVIHSARRAPYPPIGRWSCSLVQLGDGGQNWRFCVAWKEWSLRGALGHLRWLLVWIPT
jgi:hypothetical protein